MPDKSETTEWMIERDPIDRGHGKTQRAAAKVAPHWP
jgi:hypothetical protein